MTTTCNKPLELPRGASLDLLIRIPRVLADGFFVGWTVTSQLRGDKNSQFVAELEPEWTDPPTTRVLRLRNAAETSAWPVGEAWFDVRFESADEQQVIYTRAKQIYITRSITGATP